MSVRSPHKGLKFLVDFGPLVIFFVSYKLAGLMVATLAIIVATLAALLVSFVTTRRLPPMPLLTAIVVVVMGGLTLWLQDKTFIKMKPTIIFAFLALLLAGGLIIRKPTLQIVMSDAMKLSEAGWRQLTVRFALFFLGMAALNEYVWRNFSEDTWIDFKVFGILGLTILFSLSQMPLMKRHLIETPGED